jgi:hypothetical protein
MATANGSTNPGLKLKAIANWDDNTSRLQVASTKDTHDVIVVYAPNGYQG